MTPLMLFKRVGKASLMVTFLADPLFLNCSVTTLISLCLWRARAQFILEKWTIGKSRGIPETFAFEKSLQSLP